VSRHILKRATAAWAYALCNPIHHASLGRSLTTPTCLSAFVSPSFIVQCRTHLVRSSPLSLQLPFKLLRLRLAGWHTFMPKRAESRPDLHPTILIRDLLCQKFFRDRKPNPAPAPLHHQHSAV